MKRFMSCVAASLIATGSFASNEEPEVLLGHAAVAGEHCYRIVNNARKAVEEIEIGATWEGHPIPDAESLRVTRVPAGWKGDIVVKERYGYQFIRLTGPATPMQSSAGFARGDIGRVCLSVGNDLPLADIPYGFRLQGEQSRTVARARADSELPLNGVMRHVAESTDLEQAAEAIEKAEKVKEVADSLKELFRK